MSKRILFLANHFVTLFSFRKELINELISQGYEIYLSIPESDENKYFTDLGCKIVPTPIDRRGVNPFKDLKLILHYKKIISKLKPNIIFSYTIKPNIYGAIAVRLGGGKTRQVCNITGTGATFLKDNFVSKMCKVLYRFSIKKAYKVFFQNSSDRDYFIKNKMVANNWDMLPGSGVNLNQYELTPLPTDDNINFIFIGRVMKLKGIDEYLEAAKIITKKYPNTNFYIAGWNEEEQYIKIVKQYEDEGAVKYIGFQKDITEWIKKCHCTILPSHGGEGVPNVILESSAMGRICIGSNVAGTKDVIEDGKTGYLFDVKNVESLVLAIEKVLNLTADEKTKMGQAGREKVEKEFNRKIVIGKYVKEVELCE